MSGGTGIPMIAVLAITRNRVWDRCARERNVERRRAELGSSVLKLAKRATGEVAFGVKKEKLLRFVKGRVGAGSEGW